MDKWRPQNKVKLTPEQLKKLTPQQQAKYDAYEEVPKHIQEIQEEMRQRIIRYKRLQIRLSNPVSFEAHEDNRKNMLIIGNLTAADACQRINGIRDILESRRKDNQRQLIVNQPLALLALRIDVLMKPPLKMEADTIDKITRMRINRA